MHPVLSSGRDPDCTVHTLRAPVCQCIAGIALGYEDVDDHHTLRHDPVLGLLSDRLSPQRTDCAPLPATPAQHQWR
ncbi:hypothetical protein AB395_00006913 (plasmid) [Sinorhizobium fredii CCBAU 45436]|nr:hypothetical protein AB395_00006913 [Sinorhizobium fredii CCBAU 45436]